MPTHHPAGSVLVLLFAFALATIRAESAEQPLGVVDRTDERMTFTYNTPISNAPGTTYTIELQWIYRRAMRTDGEARVELVSAPARQVDEHGRTVEDPPEQWSTGAFFWLPQDIGPQCDGMVRGAHSAASSKVRPDSADGDYIDGHRYRLLLTITIPATTNGDVVSDARLFDLGSDAQLDDTSVEISSNNGRFSRPSPVFAVRTQHYLRITTSHGSGIAAFRALTVNGEPWQVADEIGPNLHNVVFEQLPPPVYTANLGEDVALTVVATGPAPLAYQWQRRSIPTAEFADIAGATSELLTLASTQPSDAGDYRVMVSSGTGSAPSRNCALRIHQTPPTGPLGKTHWLADRTIFTYEKPIENTPGRLHTFHLEWLHTYVPNESDRGDLELVSSPATPLEESFFVEPSFEPELGFPATQPPRGGFLHPRSNDPVNGTTDIQVLRDTYIPGNTFPILNNHRYRFVYELQMPAKPEDPTTARIAVFDLGLEGSPLATPKDIRFSNPRQYTQTWTSPAFASLPRFHLRVSNRHDDVRKPPSFVAVRVNGEEWPIPPELARSYSPPAPTIAAQPVTQSAARDSNVDFLVTATGPEPLAYQWRRDGVEIAGANSRSYTIDSLHPFDAGDYSVVVTGPAGSVASDAAGLTVGSSVSVDAISANRHIVASGGELELSLTATGSGPLQYQWFRNGVAIPGATDRTYARGGVTLGDVGAYSVRVTDGFGAYRSDLMYVLVAAADSRVVAWGNGNDGKTNIPSDLGDVVSVSAGTHHSLALKADGTVAGWGRSALATVPAGLGDVVAIATATGHSLALRADGTVVAWGSPTSVGFADEGQTDVPDRLYDVVAIAANSFHSLALKLDGTVVGWGAEVYAKPPTGLEDVAAIAAGYWHSLALKQDGTVVGWGNNEFGQISVPAGLSNVIAIAAGLYHSVALRADGTVVAWGRDLLGETAVPGDLTHVAAIGAAGLCTLALKFDGRIVAWGDNRNGQSAIPDDVSSVTQISTGGGHALAITGVTSNLPRITAQPRSQTTAIGTAVTLSVQVGGIGPFEYQWLLNGLPIPGASYASLAIPSTQRFQAGEYSVLVTSAAGSVTSQFAEIAVDAALHSDARLLNLSTRALSLTGDNVLIPGFVIDGSASKKLLIRAVGPTLRGFGVNGVLADPLLTLKRTVGETTTTIATNDNWGTNSNLSDLLATTLAVGAFDLGAGSADAALFTNLEPGQYSVVTEGVGGGTGVAIVELYDADIGIANARLVNISTRGFVGTGDQVMIPGFAVSNEGPKTLLIRAVGPTLGNFGVSGTLANPQLVVNRTENNGTSTPILTQDNWGDNPDFAITATIAETVGAFALTPGSADAAFVVTLQPGVYTVVGSSAVSGGTGVVLVEIYVVP